MVKRLLYWLFGKKDCKHLCMFCEYYECCKDLK